MYDIYMEHGDEYVDHYIYRSRNRVNQIIVCEAYRTYDGYINFMFYITTKRKKGYQYMKQTGKDGISSLLWAKNCLINFIFFAKQAYPNDTIIIDADDERRSIVYKRALLDLGFKQIYNKKKSFLLKL